MPTPQVVYSTTADQDFYARKVAQLGDTIETLRARAEERRQKKDQQELAEINRFFSAAEGMPELAATWGAEVKAKYGAKHPGVSQMVDAISKRAQLPALIESAGNDFSGRVNAIEQKRSQREQQIAQMPDALPIYSPMGMMSGQMQPMTEIPNEEKQRAVQEHSSVDPAYIPFMAAQEMPYEQRLAAGLWVKVRGGSVPTPSAFDPFGDDLSDQDKMGLAIEQGKITGEPAEAWRSRAGLKQSPKRLQEQGYQTEERVAREGAKVEDRIARRTDQEDMAEKKLQLEKDRLDYSDRLAAARQNRSFSQQSALIDQRGANSRDEAADPAKGLAKSLSDDSSDAQKAYDAELKAVVENASGKEKATAKAAFLKERGRRPGAISNVQARMIERDISQRIAAGELAESEAESAALEAAASYMAATGRGIQPSSALNIALGREELPVSTPQEQARQRIERIKAARSGNSGIPEEGVLPPGDPAAEAPAPAPQSAAELDTARVREVIRKKNPRWSSAQVDKALADYLATKAGG